MTPFSFFRTAFLSATALSFCATPAFAQKKKKEAAPQLAPGRMPMAPEAPPPPPPPPAPTMTIEQGITASAQHTMLVKLINGAQLAATLSGPGPLTVFAPSDDAFTRLAPGTVDTLLKPENVTSLTAILKYHVLPGAFSLDQIKAMITQGGGSASLQTLDGQPLTATLENGLVLLTDANGGKSYVSQGDVKESNGVVHIVNGVSVPKLG